jgi:hypothetical protein
MKYLSALYINKYIYKFRILENKKIIYTNSKFRKNKKIRSTFLYGFRREITK